MRKRWLQGLAANPAAPEALLLRLLDDDCASAWPILCGTRTLPQPLIERILIHPAPEVGQAFASNDAIDGRQRVRLLENNNRKAAFWLTRRPKHGFRLIHPDAMATLLAAQWPAHMTPAEWSEELLFAYGGWIFSVAATHALPRVRAYSCQYWEILEPHLQRKLAQDPSPEVRDALAEHQAYLSHVIEPAEFPEHECHGTWHILGYRNLSRALAEQVISHGNLAWIQTMARNSSLPADIVEAFTRHEDTDVRAVTASRADLSQAQIARLSLDPAAEVRRSLAFNSAITEAQRALIDYDPGQGQVCGYSPLPPFWRIRENTPAEAVSANPDLRRHAARNPDLPAELAAKLSQDKDYAVRILISLHHASVPAEGRLRSYLEYHGADREYLLNWPCFPTTGLARFATDPDPQVRLLACRDPQADPDLIWSLTHDDNATVRRHAAKCPRLPPDKIERLLHQGDTAQDAAANPALPVHIMWRLVN